MPTFSSGTGTGKSVLALQRPIRQGKSSLPSTMPMRSCGERNLSSAGSGLAQTALQGGLGKGEGARKGE